jgi:hypothetical protein
MGHRGPMDVESWCAISVNVRVSGPASASIWWSCYAVVGTATATSATSRTSTVLMRASPAAAMPQATGSSRPISDACWIVSTKWCRSTAVSNVGRRLCPVRIASANRAYICPTLNGSPRGKSAGT